MCIRDSYWLASSARKDVWGMIPKKISSFYCLVDSFGEIILFGEYSWDKLKEKLENFMFGIPISEDYTESSSCLLYTSPSPRDLSTSRMPSSA
eukprot:TRINITY_DN10586_c0_g1_i7.p2 TRINITY_DN10586_c0_g1~~TRINITY_DN10586_c0_g1_i7.p2  ORF type:complete len:107 (-),score=24.97 TRINITY_DN10586_c0_g1_i7:131-409(-)